MGARDRFNAGYADWKYFRNNLNKLFYDDAARKKAAQGRRAMDESGAEVGHAPTADGFHISDWVTCACGWESPHFWDGMDLAFDEWYEHVHDSLIAEFDDAGVGHA